jgi:hypothetical protein
VVVILLPQLAFGTPQFARKYGASCNMCHSAPPKLNQTGEDFLASGYRLADEANARIAERKTLPLAVWATGRGQWDLIQDRARGLPNRVEIISAGPVAATRAFYFVEWVPSQAGGGTEWSTPGKARAAPKEGAVLDRAVPCSAAVRCFAPAIAF